MHESLVVYNHEPMRFPRRRHPELVPAITRDRDGFPSTSQISTRMTTSMTKTSISATDGGGGIGIATIRPFTAGPNRAVSMTRLDQLAQPRRRYLEETLKQRGNGSTSNNPDIMVKSMIELPAKTPSQTNKSRLNKGMSNSMTHLNRQHQPVHQSPTRKPKSSCAMNSPTRCVTISTSNDHSQMSKRLSKSMVQLALNKSPLPGDNRSKTRDVHAKSTIVDSKLKVIARQLLPNAMLFRGESFGDGSIFCMSHSF